MAPLVAEKVVEKGIRLCNQDPTASGRGRALKVGQNIVDSR